MRTKRKQAITGSGHRLTRVRKLLGYNKKEMAARLNVSMGAYCKNESGETLPGWDTLFMLQREYDISVDWLMFNKGPMYMKEKSLVTPQMQEERNQDKQLITKLTTQMQEVNERLTDLNALRKLLPEIDRLQQAMLNDPELRYEILLNFHRHQKQNPKAPGVS